MRIAFGAYPLLLGPPSSKLQGVAHPYPDEIELAAQQAQDQSRALRALALPIEQSTKPCRPKGLSDSRERRRLEFDLEDAEGVDPAFRSIASIQRSYHCGRSTPERHLKAQIERIEALQPRLAAFVHLDIDGAVAAARGPDLPQGSLYGIPVAVKDVIDVAGMPTTCHSRLRLGHIAANDAPVVAAMRAAGAIILGKLATHEFAIGGPSFDLPFPPARNPWNTSHHPGGSSSGAGTAVAGGLVPLALGTDTAGSVRNPASACGVVGLKPTRDLLSCNGVVPLAWSLDHVGTLTRTVADAAAALNLFAPIGPALSQPRIGYVRHFHSTDMPATAEVAAALDHVAAVLGAEECHLRPLGDFALVNRVIMQCEGAAYHGDDLRRRPEWYARRTRLALQAGLFASATDYLLARRAQAMLSDEIDALFKSYDVILCASSMTPACEIDDDEAIEATYMRQARTVFNLGGHPALAMRAGLSASGLPLSVQFAARRGDEATLLAVAGRWEATMRPLQWPSIS